LIVLEECSCVDEEDIGLGGELGAGEVYMIFSNVMKCGAM